MPGKTKDVLEVTARRGNMYRRAMNRYHKFYDNETYKAATEGKSSEYGNALIDEAMALCGAPDYKVSNREWDEKAMAHLAKFCQGSIDELGKVWPAGIEVTRPETAKEINERAAERVGMSVGCQVFDFYKYHDGFSFTVETELQAYRAAWKYCFGSRPKVSEAPNVGRWSVRVYNH